MSGRWIGGLVGSAVVLAGCRSVVEVPVSVAPAEQPMVLLLCAQLEGDPGSQGIELERLGRFEVDRDGGPVVLPLSVVVRGSGQSVRVVYNRQGGSITSMAPVTWSGREGPEAAATSPPVLHFWAAGAMADGLLTVGYPLEDGGVAEVVFEQPFLDVKDPRLLLLYFPPDLDLLPVRSLAGGAWRPGDRRETSLELEHTEGFPRVRGEASLEYRGLRDGNAVFDMEVGWRGRVFPEGVPVEHVVRRRIAGEISFSTSGGISSAEFEIEAESSWPGAAGGMGRVEGTAEVRPGKGERTWEGSKGQEFAHLMELRRTDPDGFLAAVLERTSKVAAEMVRAVRPRAELAEARAMVLDGTVDRTELRRRSSHILDRISRYRVLETHGDTLARLQVLSPAEIEQFQRDFGGEEERSPAFAAAHAVGGAILVKPSHVSNLETVVHELAHVATGGFGYGNRPDLLLATVADGAPDLAWLDIDDALAAWALTEGEAVLTTAAALLEAAGGGADRLWRGWRASSEDTTESEDLLASILGFIYARSPHLFLERRRRGESFEETLARTWERFSYTTREVLFPREPAARSRLWAVLRELRTRHALSSATRIGAFLTRRLLVRRAELSWPRADRIVRELEDDVAVRQENGVLWITRWENEGAARRFEGLYAAVLGEGAVEREGRHVVATVGKPPDVSFRETLLESGA